MRDDQHSVGTARRPAIYEAVGITPPVTLAGVPQKSIEGVRMAYAIVDAKASSTRKTQYFEMLGNRALYSDGWMASTTPKRLHTHDTVVRWRLRSDPAAGSAAFPLSHAVA